MTQQYPAVIALNGPPQSGKTKYVLKYLLQTIPDAVPIYPSLVLYEMMQADGLAPRLMEYHEFKRLPGARERLIAASDNYRAVDPHVYERRIVASRKYLDSRVVIIDNVGHVADEMQFYDRHARDSLLLRVDTPFSELEPLKSRARRLKTQWPGDSRTQLEHHTMLTAYDSQQMILLLQWLSQPLTREEAGPYYGIQTSWTRYCAACEPA